jgi:hypothetical protein
MNTTLIVFGVFVCLSLLSTVVILSALALASQNSRLEERTI